MANPERFVPVRQAAQVEPLKDATRREIAAGVASLRAGRGVEGEAFMAALDADLAATTGTHPLIEEDTAGQVNAAAIERDRAGDIDQAIQGIKAVQRRTGQVTLKELQAAREEGHK